MVENRYCKPSFPEAQHQTIPWGGKQVVYSTKPMNHKHILNKMDPANPTHWVLYSPHSTLPVPQVSMLAVDEMYDDLAVMEKDLYWDATEARAPYTAATAFLAQQPSFQGSTFDIT